MLVAIVLALAAACAPAKKKVPPPQAPTLTKTDLVTGLDRPWDMAFLDDGTMFFTERSGNIHVRLPNGARHVLATGPNLPFGDPGVFVQGEAGMLGLAIDPDFATTGAIYTCFASTALDVRVARWAVNEDFTQFVGREDIVVGIPLHTASNATHSGCRIRFRPGTSELFITTGGAATDTENLAGKVLRATRDGAPFPGNPSGALVYTRGHRNPQGLAFRGGSSYSVEHGPGQDDEVNRLVGGGNYGWDGDNNNDPSNYEEAGVPMTDFDEFPDAIGPVWSSGHPTIAPSGATFLSGPQWKAWDGALALAVLQRGDGGLLRVIFLAGDQLVGELNATIGGAPFPLPRLRSAVQGPDGNLYIATDVGNGGGAIWRVVPT